MDPLFDLEGEGRDVKSTALSPPVRGGERPYSNLLRRAGFGRQHAWGDTQVSERQNSVTCMSLKF